jgi:hypothetical protein
MTTRDSTQWQNFGRRLEKIGGPPAAAWIVVNDSVRLTTRERLQNWLKDQWTYEWNLETGRYEKKTSGKLKRGWHQPWLHDHYKRSPLAGFKRHLFPPRGFFDKFFRGFYLGTASKRIFFARTDLHVTPIPFVKELLNLPGLLVVDAGVSKSENEKHPKLIGRILYDTRYATVFSAYFGWGFETDWKERERRTGDGDPYFGYDTFKFFYSGLKAEYYIDSLPFAFNFLQIRAGVRIQNKGQELVFASDKVPPRVELQIGIHR